MAGQGRNRGLYEASGVAEPVLMNWLGHKESAMVRRYYHLHDDEAHRQMKKINPLGDSEAT